MLFYCWSTVVDREIIYLYKYMVHDDRLPFSSTSRSKTSVRSCVTEKRHFITIQFSMRKVVVFEDIMSF